MKLQKNTLVIFGIVIMVILKISKYTIVFLKYVDRNPASTYLLTESIYAKILIEMKKLPLKKILLTPPIKQINNLNKKN